MVAGSKRYTYYDDDGGMTQGYTPEGYAFTAAYDAEGRLISISYTDSGDVTHLTEYTYGADGLLYQIRKVDGGAESITRIIRAGFLPIQERDGNNNVVREYVWGPSMGGGIGGLLAMKEGSNVYYYLYDGKGNVTAVTDSESSVVAAYSYDPFGVLMEKTGSLDQPFRFSTKRYDEETGLSYYGYRFYSAALGRWLSRDPLGEAGGVNLYGFIDSVGKVPTQTNLYNFVGNDPVNSVDPLGLWGVTIGFEAAGAVFGFGGVAGIYGNYSHDPNMPWYKGWSSSVTVVAGGGAAASVYGGTAGVYIGGNNSCNVSQLEGTSIQAGRMGLGAVSVEGFSSPDGSVSGGGLTIGPSLPGGYIGGFAGGTNTWTIGGGNW